ncbi:hypothetical protein Tco_0256096 [Tanacetum coccineum]
MPWRSQSRTTFANYVSSPELTDDEIVAEDQPRRKGLGGGEEHSAPAYPVVVALPATAPSVEETKPFETNESTAMPPPHPAYRMTARITILEPLPVPAWSDSKVARLLAIIIPHHITPISMVFITTPDSFPTATPDTISTITTITTLTCIISTTS